MASTSKPLVLVFSLSAFSDDDGMDAQLLHHLRTKSQVEVVKARDLALRWLSKSPQPQAILLADEYVTEKGQEPLLKKLAEYAKSGGTIVFGCRFSTFVKPLAMEAMFQRILGLPWARGSYHRTTFALNRRVENISVDSLSPSYSMKAMHLKNVAPAASVYLPTETSKIQSFVFAPDPVRDLQETPAAFAKVGEGYVGFVGDVNDEEETTPLLTAMLLASAAGLSTSTRPSVLVLSLHADPRFDTLNAELYAALRDKAEVTQASTRQEALRALTSRPRPSAVLVADAKVMDEEEYDVFHKLLAYIARRESVTVFACQFTTAVRWPDLNALFDRFGLEWRAGSYTKMDVTVTNAVDDIDFSALTVTHTYPKALFLDNVPWEESVYVPTLQYRSKETMAAFGEVEGGGRLGYVGDVNPSETITKLVLALCFPKRTVEPAPELRAAAPSHAPASISNSSANAGSAKPTILLISFDKESFFDTMEKQLLSALQKNAHLVQVVNAEGALKQLSAQPSPSAVYLTHHGFVKHDQVVRRVIEYARAGGRVVLGSHFSMDMTPDQFGPFFRKWQLPWTSGAFHRTTVALNPAGVPAELRRSRLFDAYSVKAMYLKNVSKEHKIYVPASTSTVEGTFGEPGAPLTEVLQDQCPAAWAPVGKGFLGYVGDVNSEEESVRLVLEMCSVAVSPGDLGPRPCDVGLVWQGGQCVTLRDVYSERQLPVRSDGRPPRPREMEVTARSVKRANLSKRKRIMADRLKEEGNKFFKQGKNGEAASRYRQAAMIYEPRPVYMSNLAAALLKMERYREAVSAADRAILHEPKNIKARYRRGLAKKAQGVYADAIEDFKSVLRSDPSNEPAREALIEAIRLNNGRRPPEKPEDMEETDPLWEVMTQSDSSEYGHEGNHTPCRYLNHNGCKHGAKCPFRHAPDEKSVRDQLGRNVCILWLVGKCAHGATCYYAHDKTYLHESGWWNDADKISRVGGGLELNITGHKLTDIDVYLNTLAVMQDPRSDEWMVGRFSSLDDETLHGPLGDVSLVAIQRSANPSADGDEEYDGNVNFDDEESLWNEEALQREKNLGFTNSEINELLSHGVRPYDDNAWDVLNALRRQ